MAKPVCSSASRESTLADRRGQARSSSSAAAQTHATLTSVYRQRRKKASCRRPVAIRFDSTGQPRTIRSLHLWREARGQRGRGDAPRARDMATGTPS